jgi:hypothetical protein
MRFRMESVHRNPGFLARFGDRPSIVSSTATPAKNGRVERIKASTNSFVRPFCLTVVENRRHDEGWWRVGVNGS